MTEITAPKSAVTAEQFADEIREQLKYTQGVTVEQAKPADVYVAASAAVRRHLVDSWMKTQADMVNGNTKACPPSSSWASSSRTRCSTPD